MTTYSVSGLAAYSDSGTGATKALDQSDLRLEFVVEDGVSTFSYSSVTVVPGEPPISTINIDSQAIFVNGLAFGSSFTPDFTSVFQLTWRDAGGIVRTSVILSFGEANTTVPGLSGTVNAEYSFVIAGSSLPHFSSLSAWDTFNNSSVISFANPTGAFAPGANIALTNIGATVTEDDLIIGSTLSDILKGGVGDDILRGGNGADILMGGAGTDTADYSDYSGQTDLVVDLVNPSANRGSAEGDTFFSIENIIGSDGRDQLSGDQNNNKIIGGGNDDFLSGHGGNDILKGGEGTDTLYGGDGDDRLIGGEGSDFLTGGSGADQLIGGKGRDYANYGSYNEKITIDLAKPENNTGDAKGDTFQSIEVIYGSSTAENRLFGNAGRNYLSGGESGDVMFGRDGNDTFVGFGGADKLFGGRGNDKLFGYAGDDILRGGAGRDKLYGGHGYTDSNSGDDLLIGGKGSDRFVFQNKAGNDTIKDFDVDDLFEVVDLSAVTSITGFLDLKRHHMSDSGSDVVIDDGDGTVITLLNVTKAELGMDDFIFS